MSFALISRWRPATSALRDLAGHRDHVDSRMRRFYTPILLCGAVLAAADTDCLPLDRYVVLSGQQAVRAQLLECPNHAFGTMDDGIREIEKRKAELLPGQIPFAQFCVTDQVDTVRRCMPLLGAAAANPFVLLSDRQPAAGSPLWSGWDHPVINRVRDLREAAGTKRLLARIPIGGVESKYITKREPTFEEIEWMILATVGADFKGIVWVGQFDTGGRLRNLGHNLLCFADDLGTATPVGWATAPEGQPVSALASKKMLFVVLLHPEYFQEPVIGQIQKLPLDPKVQTGEVTLTLPDGVTTESGISLYGKPLKPRSEGSKAVVPYRFAGGGEMLVLDLKSWGER